MKVKWHPIDIIIIIITPLLIGCYFIMKVCGSTAQLFEYFENKINWIIQKFINRR